jgi:hypothetical protein
MDKIKELLAKSGCKPELVNAIAESLDRYKTGLQDQFAANFNSKVENAKKVCVEETEAHKRELARRLQIFCETKSAAIETQLAKMSALSESQAMTKLKNVRALLEGVQLNGVANGQSAAALEKAKRRAQQLEEERNRAVAEANRKTAIAEKALKQNRALVSENAKLQNASKTVVENRSPRRMEPTVRNSKPTTTRATLLESQERRPAPRSQQSNVTVRPTGNITVLDIAANMDTDLV